MNNYLTTKVVNLFQEKTKSAKKENMNWKKISNYIYFICILWTIPFLLNFLFEQFDGDKGNPMFFTLIFLFSIANIVYSQVSGKSIFWKRILIALLIVIASVALCAGTIRMDFLPVYDPYGIMTFIFGNGIFTILLWEIIYRSGILERKKHSS